MPIFEYRCQDCGRKFSLLIGPTAASEEERCPKCGSWDVAKLVSRFRRFKNEDERIDEMADRLEHLGEDVSDTETRNLVREMGKAMDDDFSDELEEMYESDQESDDPDELD